MYRDLRPGATGDDVLQLEEALSRLGFLGVVADEIWDADTGAAVAEWYETAGYRPNGLSEEEEASLSAAQDRVRAAEGAVADAEAGLREAQSGSGESAVPGPSWVPPRIPWTWPNSTPTGPIRWRPRR